MAPERPRLRLAVEPSEELRQLVEHDPADFTWAEFERELVVRATTPGGTPAEGTLRIELCILSLDGTAHVFGEDCTDEFQVRAERLAEGVPSGELLGGSGSALREHGAEHSPLDDHDPGGFVVPSERFVSAATSEVARSVAAESRGDDPTMWYAEVVYARPAVVRVGREPPRVRPFGLLIDPHEY